MRKKNRTVINYIFHMIYSTIRELYIMKYLLLHIRLNNLKIKIPMHYYYYTFYNL